MIFNIFAIIAVIIFILLTFIQITLAFGAPWGKIAWGGKIEGKLPRNLRIGSLLTVFIFIFITITTLDRVNLISVFNNSQISVVATWIFAGFLVLNTLGNFMSVSKWEKRIMTPASLIASVCLFIIAIGMI
jgi:hypothetical protein